MKLRIPSSRKKLRGLRGYPRSSFCRTPSRYRPYPCTRVRPFVCDQLPFVFFFFFCLAPVAALCRFFQAAFNKIPSGGPLLPLLNGALVLGAVGYCGYNSVFTGKSWSCASRCLGGMWYNRVYCTWSVVCFSCCFSASSSQKKKTTRAAGYVPRALGTQVFTTAG